MFFHADGEAVQRAERAVVRGEVVVEVAGAGEGTLRQELGYAVRLDWVRILVVSAHGQWDDGKSYERHQSIRIRSRHIPTSVQWRLDVGTH